MNLTKGLLLLSLLIHSFTLMSQNSITIKGNIRNTESQQVVENVEIFSDPKGILHTSDINGCFTITEVPIGLNTLTLFREGFNTTYISFIARKDTILEINLKALSVELTEIQLRARRKEEFAMKRLKDVEGTSLYAGKKSEVVVMNLVSANLASNNSRQIYAQVTGLNVYEGSDGGLQLSIGGRGLDPNRTSNFNTRQNGYDISADVLGYPESYYSPPSEAISEIQIVRGASSLQYGTQFGGLLNFKLREIPSFIPIEILSKQTIGSYGLFNTYNYIGITKDKFSFNLSYNYKRGDGYRENSHYKSHSIFFSTHYRPSANTLIKAEYTHFNYLAKQGGGLTDTQFGENPRQSTRVRNWFNVNWNLFNIKMLHEFTKKNRFSISLFGLSASRNSVGFRGNPVIQNENPIISLDEQDSENNHILPRDLIIGNFRNIGAEIKWLSDYRIAQKNAIFLVGAKMYKAKNNSIQGPGSLGVDADFELRSSEFSDYPAQSNFRLPNSNYSVFSENIVYLSEHLSITPGIRFEFIRTGTDGTYNQVVFDNAGNSISNNLFNEQKSLSRSFAIVGVGLSYKKNKKANLYANISQNYRSVTFSDIRVVSPTFIVDPDIRDERGFTADLGLRGVIDKKITYELNAYSILYDDRIGIILDDRANRVRKNIGKAAITGIESLLNVNVGEVISVGPNISIDAFANTSLTYSRYLESEENNVEGNRVEFIPNLNLKLGAGFGYKNFSLTGQVSHLSEQYTDVQNSEVDVSGGVRNGIIGPIPSYTVVDFSLTLKLKSLKFESGLTNALNHNYFTRRATGYPGPGIIPSEGRSFYFTLSYTL
mgnify:CR=1 FL=1|tara:strand:- start:3617 stop:6094 length:2478 start_codon:yes stop_codon:yes gene_type:complete